MKWRASRASELLHMADEFRDDTDPLGTIRRAALAADAEGDVETAVQARRWLVHEAAEFREEYDLVAAFAWLTKKSKTDPDLVHPSSLSWTFKWVVEHLFGLVAVSRSAIESLLGELERQHVADGLDRSAALQLRLMQVLEMRDREAIPERFKAWSEDEEGAGADCDACRRNVRVRAFTAMGEYERAVTEARPILEGTMTCGEIPALTFPHVVECYQRLGNLEGVKRNCHRGVRALADEHTVHFGIGTYLVALAVTQQLEPAFKLLRRWFRQSLHARNDVVRFQFLRGAGLVCRASDKAGEESVYLTLPPTFDGYVPDGLYDAAELGRHFDERAEELATRFDARHGNDGFWEQLRADRTLIEA